ncbi:MAG: HAMP domain-containing histidine kinase [Rhodospirillaceae bacterium]|nr:HAMP domain-containing histidine kinase [Rhodospirillaceae bacterium]MBT6118939.1 HAMP domain-containing histidine kinase [Rhodospirillaceae bacterium]
MAGERLDEAAVDPKSHVAAEQTRLLYRSWYGQFANLINPAILVVILYDALPHFLLFGWWLALAAVTAWRIALVFGYRRASAGPGDAPNWAKRYAFGAGLSGALWGLSSGAVFYTSAALLHGVIAFVLAGMTAGAVAISSAYFPAFVAFAVPAVGMLVVAFLVHGGMIHIGLAAMSAVYLLILLAVARSWNRTIARSIELQLSNADLIRRLEIERDRAQAANRAKTDFLANMSHELRTPLNAILGFSEFMRREMLGPLGVPAYRDYVDDIHNSGSHLHALINDILDVAKAEAGVLQFDEGEFDIEEVVESAVRMMRTASEHAGIEVSATIPPNTVAILGDRRRVRQVLLNLLSNAIKFTEPGGRIAVRSAPVEAGLEVTVEDSGIGMSPEQIERAFEPFSQFSVDPTRTREGTGLGLGLSRRIMDQHGGSLDLESRPGKGTTARLVFPTNRLLPPEDSLDAAIEADTGEVDSSETDQ